MIIDQGNKINQGIIKDSKINSLKILYKVLKSICKIITSDGIGTGFFLKIEKKDETFYCIMTCEHVVTHKMIVSQEDIKILFDNEEEKIYINLNDKERFIKSYKYLNIDATVIQILPKDNIDDKYYLSPNLDYLNGYEQFKNKKIYIPQFPNGENLSSSDGKIEEVNYYNNEIIHKASTLPGSSGSPIFLENSTLVLGIHKQGNLKEESNYANFIGPIVYSIQNDLVFAHQKTKDSIYIGDTKNGIKDGYGKLLSKNGEIYLGQWKNGEKKGKGSLRKCKEIIYEGDFYFDKPEGFGKYYYKNGNFYLGQFIEGKRHGKGIEYNKDKKIIYDGEFAFDNYEGEGKLFLENGCYYIGQFIDGRLKNEKVKKYTKNDELIYEGGLLNDEYEGEGKLLLESGNYYIGKFVHGEQTGKGKIVDKNNEILFNGIFSKGNIVSGNGRFKLDDGDIYKGEINDGKFTGKGELYRGNNLLFKGIFKDNRPMEGFGRIEFTDGSYYIGEVKYFQPHGKGTKYGRYNDVINSGFFFMGEYTEIPEYVSVISQVLTNNNNLNNNRGEEAANIGNLAFQNPFLGLGQLFLNSLINDN